MRTLAVVLAIVGAYRVRRRGLGVRDVKVTLQSVMQGSLASVLQILRQVKKQVAA